MINVNSKVTLNMDYLRRLTEAQAVALEQTAEALHSEVKQEQVVPRDTGALQGTNMFVDFSGSKKGTVSIVHSTPYARRLYYHPEYHFSTGKSNRDTLLQPCRLQMPALPHNRFRDLPHAVFR